MSDFVSAVTVGALHRLIVTWRSRRRRVALEDGVLSTRRVPCGISASEGAGAARRIKALGGRLEWRARTTKDRIVLFPGSVQLLVQRSPTPGEAWWVDADCVIHKVRVNDDLLEVALLPTDAVRFRQDLNLPRSRA